MIEYCAAENKRRKDVLQGWMWYSPRHYCCEGVIVVCGGGMTRRHRAMVDKKDEAGEDTDED